MSECFLFTRLTIFIFRWVYVLSYARDVCTSIQIAATETQCASAESLISFKLSTNLHARFGSDTFFME